MMSRKEEEDMEYQNFLSLVYNMILEKKREDYYDDALLFIQTSL